MHACPIQPEFEEVEFSFESQGLTLTRSHKKTGQRRPTGNQGGALAGESHPCAKRSLDRSPAEAGG